MQCSNKEVNRKKRDKDTMTKQSHPNASTKSRKKYHNFFLAKMKISCKMEGHAKNKIRQNDRRKMRRPTLTSVVGPTVMSARDTFKINIYAHLFFATI